MAERVGCKDQIFKAMSLFRCDLDKDIGTFLCDRAMAFDKANICRVYVILDEQALALQEIKIDAYFTLSYKALEFPESLSKTKRKAITDKKDSALSNFVLIGQLGKYIEKISENEYKRASITSKEILDFAFEIIRENNRLIPCKFVLVEVKVSDNDYKVIQKYEEYGFQIFQDDGKFHQYIMKSD